MSKIAKLVTLTELEAAQERAGAVEMLKDLLAEAEAGEIHGIAVAVVKSDLAINTAWSDSRQVGLLLGAVSLLQHRLISEGVECP